MPPIAPTVPPIPITEPTAARGNTSDGSVYRLAENAWWAAVDKCNYHNSEHMSEEERQGLTDFRRTVPLQERTRLAIQYLAFEAKHAGSYQRQEKDPDDYIEKNQAA